MGEILRLFHTEGLLGHNLVGSLCRDSAIQASLMVVAARCQVGVLQRNARELLQQLLVVSVEYKSI